MAEKSEELIPWWVHYRTPDKQGFAIGFLQQDARPGYVVLIAHKWHSGLGAVGYVGSHADEFREDLIVDQGPCVLGRKVTQEQHEAWLKEIAESGGGGVADADE